MLRNVKTGPKVLLGAIVIGGLIYGLMQVDLKSKLPKPEVKPVEVTQVAPPTPAETQAAQAPAPAPVEPAPQQQSTLQPSNPGNAGLDAVLGAGKKK